MSINLISNVQFPLPFTQFNNRSDDGEQHLTIAELRMNDLSYTLRNKPSWWTDLRDPVIRAQWTEEALRETIRGGKLSEKDVAQVLDELEDYAKIRADPTGILPSCYFRSYESDSLISEDLKARLLRAIIKLENAPDQGKDWRPGSGGVVLDLADPAMFSAVYGRTLRRTTGPDKTRALERLMGPSMDRALATWSYSTRFSWIPTDFQLASNGEPAKALGYINNIHPEHGRELVPVIEALIGRFSLLWDRVLTDLHPRNAKTLQGRRQDLIQRNETYSTQGKKLQVFVRLSGVYLTPENPEYTGSPWNVLGRANERIVAAGVYYYDSENATEPEMAFRVPVSFGSSVRRQNDAESIKLTWGLEEGQESNQVVGVMKTPTDRCIAFPNVYQYQTSRIKLIDPTKSGYRKLIGFLLVDPENHIPSTTDIPPQRTDWPQSEIEDNLGNSMTLEEARAYREQARIEEQTFVRVLNEQHFETKLSF